MSSRRVRKETARLLQSIQEDEKQWRGSGSVIGTENVRLGSHLLQLCALGVWCADAEDRGELATLFCREQGMRALLFSTNRICGRLQNQARANDTANMNFGQLYALLHTIDKLLRCVQRDTTLFLAVQPPPYGIIEVLRAAFVPLMKRAVEATALKVASLQAQRPRTFDRQARANEPSEQEQEASEVIARCLACGLEIVGSLAAGGEACTTVALDAGLTMELMQLASRVRSCVLAQSKRHDVFSPEVAHRIAAAHARLRAAVGADRGTLKDRSSQQTPSAGSAAAQMLLRTASSLAASTHLPIPRRRGVRVLSIDGGGSRAVVALQILQRIETDTGRRIRDLFDVIGGTSSGGLLALALGVRNMTVQECIDLCTDMSSRIFVKGAFSTGYVILNRGQYDTKALEAVFKSELGSSWLIDSRAQEAHEFCVPDCSVCQSTHEGTAGSGHTYHRVPKVFAVSTRMGASASAPADVYLHSNYRPPVMSPVSGEMSPAAETKSSRYAHGVHHRLWEAARATTAAPAYFDPLQSGDELFCDGALLVNNPTAIAVHEARMLFPDRPLEIVVSVGSGRQEIVRDEEEFRVLRSRRGQTVIASRNGELPVHREGDVKVELPPAETDKTTASPFGSGASSGLTAGASQPATNLRVRVLALARALIDSATDTEAVHHAMEDLAPSNVYFRLNPVLSREQLILDESRPVELENLAQRTQEYLEQNADKMASLTDILKTATNTNTEQRALFRRRQHKL
ncbi:Calcium-independent phospholipase A2-gamma [Porphyridium purpureum]|uniref:Calcium-independent phospholipase A2-gamma n=1 Tax=Porphyridium purpureum TaxID=35688 RepID=A0A5J4Z6W4_PORPP|nr:Calcium-independent phospholipase A2-gamma [Porphyridium purpureum]|eukprot:POR5615..scf295_1